MSAKTIAKIKSLSKQLGIYHQARRVYRRFSPMVRDIQKRDRDIYAKYFQQGDLVFDVGTNLGQKSEVFLGLGARVVGFEPNPLCQAELTKKLGHNKNYTLVPAAVGREISTAEFHFEGTSPTSSLKEDWARVEGFTDPEKTTVDITTLDTQIETHGMPVFCKIDVEGFEIEVLSGLSQAPKTVTFEYVRRDADTTIACLTRMQEIGAKTANVMPHVGQMDFDSPIPIDTLIRKIKADELPHRFGDIFCFA